MLHAKGAEACIVSILYRLPNYTSFSWQGLCACSLCVQADYSQSQWKQQLCTAGLWQAPATDCSQHDAQHDACQQALHAYIVSSTHLTRVHAFPWRCRLFVSAGKLHPELMEAAALHSQALMTTFQPQSVANMIWAYATLAHTPPTDFLTLLCGHALHELPSFSPQNISNTIWALATLKHTNRV